MAIITLATLRDYWKKIYDNIIAHDAVDSGDPLKIGGKASTAAPTAVSVGDRVNAWFDLNGRLVVLQDQPSALPTGAATDAKMDTLIAKDFATQTTLASLLAKVITAPSTEAKQDTLIAKDFATQTTLAAVLAKVIAAPATEAKQDSLTTLLTNVEGTALTSAARTATESSADLTNSRGKGVRVVLDVTAATGSPSITLTIECKDAASGKYCTLLLSAAVTGISMNTFVVYPGIVAVTNLATNNFVSKTFRITMTHSNTDSITYSTGYSLV